MIGSKMTPGPWEAVEDPAYDDHWDVRVGDDGYVCEGCSEPDARAIAEVPEMVKLLREIQPYLFRTGYHVIDEPVRDHLVALGPEVQAILARIDGGNGA